MWTAVEEEEQEQESEKEHFPGARLVEEVAK